MIWLFPVKSGRNSIYFVRLASGMIIRNACRAGDLAVVDDFTPCFMYY